jgi:Spy/CpxP family protein refolding chaperone
MRWILFLMMGSLAACATRDTKASVGALRGAMLTDVAPLNDQLRTLQAQRAGLWKSANPDPVAIRQNGAQIVAARASIRAREAKLIAAALPASPDRRPPTASAPLAQRLQLSPDQATKLKQIIAAMMATISPQLPELRSARVELHALLLAHHPDDARIDSALVRLSAINATIFGAKVDMKLAVLAMLDARQRAGLVDPEPELRCDCGDGCCSGGNGGGDAGGDDTGGGDVGGGDDGGGDGGGDVGDGAGSGGGGQGDWCTDLSCFCYGDDDCANMFDSGACDGRRVQRCDRDRGKLRCMCF